jgi:hypothetical protein
MRALVLVALALAACNPYLSAQSTAPPGRTARLDAVNGFWGTTKSYRLELSRGVAIAITCYYGGPCEHLQVIADDPAIAEVRPASLGVLEKAGYSYNNQPAAAIVVIGKATGVTHLHVVAKEGRRDIAVTVVATPGIPPVTQVAR